MPKSNLNPLLLIFFAVSFGASLGAGAGYAVLAPSSDKLGNTLIGALQGAVISGLAAFVATRLAKRSYKLSTLFSLTLLVAVVITSHLHWTRRPEVSDSGFSLGGALTASNPVVAALNERRQITESCFATAMQELRMRGLSGEILFDMSSEGERRPESWRIQIDVFRKSGEAEALVVSTGVSGKGNADSATIEPVVIRHKINTDESHLFDTALVEAYVERGWLHEIVDE